MNLFKSEVRRIKRRNLTLIFGIFAAAGLLLLTGIMWFSSQKGPSEADLAEAQAQADEMNGEYAECVENEQFFEDNPDYAWIAEDPYYEDMEHEEMCSEFFLGGEEWTAEDFIYVYTFKFHEEGVDIIMGAMLAAALLAMLLAASAIGAEWSSGGMSNTLVWHPNRMRVWGAKLGAALTVTLIALVAVGVLAFGLLYLTATVRGETGTLSPAWWEDSLAKWSRTAVLGLGMTVLGSALAMLGRHTAIAGGVIAGYLIIGDMLVRFASLAAQISYPDRFSLYTWVSAWIEGRMELHDWTSDGTAKTLVLTSTDAGLLLGAIVAAFAVLATWSFAKRDVN